MTNTHSHDLENEEDNVYQDDARSELAGKAAISTSEDAFMRGYERAQPYNKVNEMNEKVKLEVASPAFENEAEIPKKYTCDGEDQNPPLNIGNIPATAESLVVIADDPDAPSGTFTHWVLFNIPVTSRAIPEGTEPGTAGMNDFEKTTYGGPCPPSGTHRYFFRVYALNKELELNDGVTRSEVEEAMEGSIVGNGELRGTYSRGGG